MKKLVILTIATLSILALAQPAGAIWRGKVCRTFPGPDGSGGVEVKACAIVNDHDFEDKIQGMLELTNVGTKVADARVGYVALLNTVGTVRQNGPWALLMIQATGSSSLVLGWRTPTGPTMPASACGCAGPPSTATHAETQSRGTAAASPTRDGRDPRRTSRGRDREAEGAVLRATGRNGETPRASGAVAGRVVGAYVASPEGHR